MNTKTVDTKHQDESDVWLETPQGARGRGMKRGGGRASIGSRKRPAKAVPAGADLIGKRILVLQTPPGADPEWHIGTIMEWLGVRHVANLTPHTFPVCSITGCSVQKEKFPHIVCHSSGSHLRVGTQSSPQPGWECTH